MKNSKKILQWILFLPVGYFLFYISQLLVFLGLSFLLFLLQDLNPLLLIIMSAGIVGPIFFIIILILGGSAFGASHISPNKKAYWVLITIYLVSGFRSVFQYCSAGPIPDDPSIITIQLPCWAYALIFLLQIASIVLVGIFHEKTSADDAKKLESVSKKASLTTKEKERIQKLAIGALEEWAELAEQKEDNNIQKNQ